MADKLFPMYCGKSGIGGMSGELSKTQAIMNAVAPRGNNLVLIYMNGTQEWVFGLCSFKYDIEHDSNFKFSNTFANLQDQNVLPTLIQGHSVKLILTDDLTLANRVRDDPATRGYADRVALVAHDGTGYARVSLASSGASKPSLLSRLGWR